MNVVVKSKSNLVVPASIRRKAGIRIGDQVEFKVSGGVIKIIPKLPSADDEYTPEQRRAIDRDLDKGLDDAKRGRVRGPFASHKEFIDSLHKDARKIGRPKAKRSS
jgi:AbrB family looped-hinge helix DNA binding protein